MKKLIVLLSIALILASCAQEKKINGVTYRPYGLLNANTCKNDSVEYQVSGWALFSGIFFIETIIVPIYDFGFNFWEPVGLKKDYVKGIKRDDDF